ncbi:DUF6713 family protein [Pseudanabaena galeata UHCC 0370]|uniref:DUF6713 family protein n=1 Tax=Pseudanabaena galeata UHCC 0370 TaxID=3110310 RepID=A0ABU5TDL7_9CYAN|nr:DUF6713 family protein [Pseudanabaena galeata]MEA5476364.1 DUF6713 family protein [Pseudanabaena galeata UHCC 0370]
MKNLLFNLGLATLSTHELDAVTQSEWHLLYILNNLPEQIAADTFVVLHVPLFTIIFWLGFNENLKVKKWARIIFSLFLIIHVGLHKALENHPLYTFNSLISKCLIFGAGLIGLLYLIALIGETYYTKTETKNSMN